jgi:hypothetical protein
MSLKQLFCKHIWKTISIEETRKVQEEYGHKWSAKTYAKFQYFALKQKCLKCDKTRLVETRKLEI